MKRYQCIKNVEMLAMVGVSGSNGQIAFRQGKVYPGDNNHVRDEFNNTWSANHPKIVASLKELPTIDDHEEEEARAVPITTKDTRKISWGCAILIVTFLTVLALIFLR